MVKLTKAPEIKIKKKIKDLFSENRLLYLEDSVGEFVDEMEYEFNKQLKETGVIDD